MRNNFCPLNAVDEALVDGYDAHLSTGGSIWNVFRVVGV